MASFSLIIWLLLFLPPLYVLPLCYVWRARSGRWLGVFSVLLLSWVGYLLFRYTLPSDGNDP